MNHQNLKGNPTVFTDLSKDHRFYNEMLFLEDKGIIKGYPDGTFRPDEEVTRAAAAIMIGRALGIEGKQKDTQIPRCKRPQKSSGYIAALVD